MKRLSKDDLLAIGIRAAQLVFVMDSAVSSEECTEEEMEVMYNGTMNELSKFLDAVLAEYKQDYPETDLEDGEILHVLSCPSCRKAIVSGNTRVH